MVFNVVPDGDVATPWTLPVSGFHYITIDEYPGQNDGDLIGATDINDGETEEFTLQDATLTIGKCVTQIVVHTRNNGTGDAPSAQVTIWNGVSWESWQSIPHAAGVTNRTTTFTGLAMTQTDVNNLKVRYKSGTMPKGASMNIHRCYLALTEGDCPITGPEDIDEISGIPSADIDEKYGIAWTDIEEIYGIS